jgi:hypothetical protein
LMSVNFCFNAIFSFWSSRLSCSQSALISANHRVKDRVFSSWRWRSFCCCDWSRSWSDRASVNCFFNGALSSSHRRASRSRSIFMSASCRWKI